MPVFVGWIIAGLASAAGGIVFRVLAALGIGFVTYTGVDLLLSGAEAKIFELMGQMGPNVVAMYGVLKIGQCIKTVFVGLAMRAALSGFSGGSSTKMVGKSA
jgi:hypothetical protein